MTILVTYQVITRYLFNDPSAVSEVLSRYLFIWLILIGSAYVFGLREHIAITFMRDRMPRKVRIFLEILGEFATTVFVLLVLTIGGYIGMSRQMGQLDSALQIPIGVIYAAIPISGVLSIFIAYITNMDWLDNFLQSKRCNHGYCNCCCPSHVYWCIPSLIYWYTNQRQYWTFFFLRHGNDIAF